MHIAHRLLFGQLAGFLWRHNEVKAKHCCLTLLGHRVSCRTLHPGLPSFCLLAFACLSCLVVSADIAWMLVCVPACHACFFFPCLPACGPVYSCLFVCLPFLSGCSCSCRCACLCSSVLFACLFMILSVLFLPLYPRQRLPILACAYFFLLASAFLSCLPVCPCIPFICACMCLPFLFDCACLFYSRTCLSLPFSVACACLLCLLTCACPFFLPVHVHLPCLPIHVCFAYTLACIRLSCLRAFIPFIPACLCMCSQNSTSETVASFTFGKAGIIPYTWEIPIYTLVIHAYCTYIDPNAIKHSHNKNVIKVVTFWKPSMLVLLWV